MKVWHIVVGLLIVVLLFVLTGCSSSDQEDINYYGNNEVAEDIYEVNVPMDNGDTVRCIVFSGLRKGGITCDWEGAR